MSFYLVKNDLISQSLIIFGYENEYFMHHHDMRWIYNDIKPIWVCDIICKDDPHQFSGINPNLGYQIELIFKTLCQFTWSKMA